MTVVLIVYLRVTAGMHHSESLTFLELRERLFVIDRFLSDV